MNGDGIDPAECLGCGTRGETEADKRAIAHSRLCMDCLRETLEIEKRFGLERLEE